MSSSNKNWDQIYQDPSKYTYYNVFRPHKNIKKIIKWLKSKKINQILDLGSGMGRNFFSLLEADFDVYGIDQSSISVNYIKSKISPALSKKIVVGEFQRLPYPNNIFEAVISIQTLNHGYQADVTKGISEIERVLKPGGYIFVTLPGRTSQGKLRYCLVKTAKKVEAHTYIPTIGEEAGIPHYIFNKKLIKKHFKKFKNIAITKDEQDYYCISGQKPVR